MTLSVVISEMGKCAWWLECQHEHICPWWSECQHEHICPWWSECQHEQSAI